jgi:alcohol dehydrogenase
MTIGTFRLPQRVHFGFGSRAQLAEILLEHGTNVLIVVDPFFTRAPAFVEVLDSLAEASIQTVIVSDIQPELPIDSLVELGNAAREMRPDAILAIGGGSTLDAAKVIALLARFDGPLNQYYGENAVPGAILPIVAMPTTAGTGSEVTPVAVVSDPSRELKVGISSPWLVPVAAVIDPEFTVGAPAAVTAYAGMDALVHVVESFTARPLEIEWAGALPVFMGQNAFTDTIAIEATARIGRWLPVAVAEPRNRIAREHVAFGSTLGGIAFAATGTHLAHALQYPIGALTHTPHGLGTGLLLPYVMNAIRVDRMASERLAQLAVALGSTATAVDVRVDDAIEAVIALNESIGVPASLAEIGVEYAQLDRIAELGMLSTRLVNISPVDVSRELLLDILEHAHSGHLTERQPS